VSASAQKQNTKLNAQKPTNGTAPKAPTPQGSGGFSPVKFFEDVRAEAKRVTWPTRRATMVTTGAVLAMAALTSVFFFVVDQVIGLGVRELFGVGG